MFRVSLMALSLLVISGTGRADDVKQDSNTHLGTWRQVAVIADGKDIPVGGATLLIVTREGYTVTVDGKVYQKGTTKADRTKSPVQSDVTITEGANAGKTVRQISKIEGDVLIACMGVERPTEFKSIAGSGQTLSVWLRVK